MAGATAPDFALESEPIMLQSLHKTPMHRRSICVLAALSWLALARPADAAIPGSNPLLADSSGVGAYEITKPVLRVYDDTGGK